MDVFKIFFFFQDKSIELKFVTSRVTNFFFFLSWSYDQQDNQKFAE